MSCEIESSDFKRLFDLYSDISDHDEFTKNSKIRYIWSKISKNPEIIQTVQDLFSAKQARKNKG